MSIISPTPSWQTGAANGVIANNSKAQSWERVIVADIINPNNNHNASDCHKNAPVSVCNAKDE